MSDDTINGVRLTKKIKNTRERERESGLLVNKLEVCGSPCLVVKGGARNQRVVSSNPSAGYWMDIFSH